MSTCRTVQPVSSGGSLEPRGGGRTGDGSCATPGGVSPGSRGRGGRCRAPRAAGGRGGGSRPPRARGARCGRPRSRRAADGTRSLKMRTPWLSTGVRPWAARRRAHLGLVEPARGGVVVAPAPVGALEDRPGRGRTGRPGPGRARRAGAARRRARGCPRGRGRRRRWPGRCPGRRRPRGCRAGRRGRRPAAAVGAELADGVGVALHRVDPLGGAGLGRPAAQRGQGVGAGVDDGDVVAGRGERDGGAAGAATEVEHPQRAAELGAATGREGVERRLDGGRAQPGLGARAAGSATLVGHGGSPWSIGVARAGRRRSPGPP